MRLETFRHSVPSPWKFFPKRYAVASVLYTLDVHKLSDLRPTTEVRRILQLLPPLPEPRNSNGNNHENIFKLVERRKVDETGAPHFFLYFEKSKVPNSTFSDTLEPQASRGKLGLSPCPVEALCVCATVREIWRSV